MFLISAHLRLKIPFEKVRKLGVETSSSSSVTWWLDYFSIFAHLWQFKYAQCHKMFAKVGSKFYQVVNKAFKSCPNTFKFCQSGEISPSLFTLSSFTYFEKGEILSLKVFGSFQKNLRKYPPHFFVVNRSQIFLQLDHIELLMHYTHCPDSNHQSLARTARH